MSSPRSRLQFLSSPSSNEDSSINLLRGTNTSSRFSLLKCAPKESMIWNSGLSAENNRMFFKIRDGISKEYKSVLQGCLVDVVLEVQFDNNFPPYGEASFARFLSFDRSSSQNIYDVNNCVDDSVGINIIEECLNNSKSKIVALHLRIATPLSAHANIIIFDRQHRTAEIYDPNGYAASQKYYPYLHSTVSSLLQLIPSMEFYRICPLKENNLKKGLQAFESRYEGYGDYYIEGGLCIKWVYYILQLRLENYKDSPSEFKKRINDRIAQLMRYKSGITRSGKEARGQYMTNYIIDYMLTAATTTSPIRSRRRVSPSPPSFKRTSRNFRSLNSPRSLSRTPPQRSITARDGSRSRSRTPPKRSPVIGGSRSAFSPYRRVPAIGGSRSAFSPYRRVSTTIQEPIRPTARRVRYS